MFFTYSQNNSGGSFDVDDDVCGYVIIEAPSATVADAIAESKGVYFDGCYDGRDCDCCGDRWSRQWDDSDGTEVPTIYGDPITEDSFSKWKRTSPNAIIHRWDGTKEVL